MRVLIVEDEVRLARSLKKAIETMPSYVADICLDGTDGEHLALTENYDLILLDLMLPGVDGLTLLQAVRAAGRRTPVLVLTARAGKQDVVRGLDYGCDDYLSKPFDMGELLARIKSLVRRSYDRPDPLLRVGDLTIDTHRHVVERGGRSHVLPALEYRLLEYLAYNAGRVVSKTEILEHLYDYNWEKFSNVVEVYVSALRRRLDGPGTQGIIHTIRGQGYVLRPPQPHEDLP